MITAYISNDKVTSTSPEAFSTYEKSRFGEKKEGKVEYTLQEAIYLLENKKIKIQKNKKVIDLDKIINLAKKTDKNFLKKYLVFKDLRKKGYVVKTAFKFGAEFRVYNKGVKPGQDHAKWIVFVSKESDKFNWHDFSAKNRVAHSTKKKLLLAVIDLESDITYYEISWIRI